MPIYDTDGTVQYPIQLVLTDNGYARHYVAEGYESDGTAQSLVYSARHTQQLSATVTMGWDGEYGPWAEDSCTLTYGEIFRIRQLSFSQGIYTNLQVELTINDGGRTLYSYNQTVGEYTDVVVGPIPGDGSILVADGSPATVRLRVRSWASSASWNDGNTHTQTVTAVVEAGV